MSTHTVTTHRHTNRLAYTTCTCGWRSGGCDTYGLAVSYGDTHSLEHAPLEDLPECAICDEGVDVEGGEGAEMVPPANAGAGHLVHAECGLAAGWEIA